MTAPSTHERLAGALRLLTEGFYDERGLCFVHQHRPEPSCLACLTLYARRDLAPWEPMDDAAAAQVRQAMDERLVKA